MPTLLENKQARWRYRILDTWEAGIVLTGQEVKSVKTGQGDLRSAYVTVRPLASSRRRRARFAALLVNASIPPYPKAGPVSDYDPRRPRQLLLHRGELAKLIGHLETPGLTMVPLKVYTLNRRVKVLVGLAAGKTSADKRQTIREREASREARQTMLRRSRRDAAPR